MSRRRPKLRIIARSEVLPKPVRELAAAELDFDIEFELIDSVKGLQRVVTRPDTFDVYHQWHTIDLIWTARAIQAIDLRRIDKGREIRARALAQRGDGRMLGSMFDKLFLQPSGALSSAASDEIIMLPVLHGVDAFGYLPAALKEFPPDTPASWGWLLDPRLHGRVAIMNEPALGMIEAALAVEAAENFTFADVGNLSIEEIDIVADTLIRKKKLGHFKTIWGNYEEAARSMQRGTVLQSIFSPAIAMLRRQGVPVISAVPQEGYRGWHVDLCISSAARGDALDAAYAYLNWWMNGRAGGVVARQGYYFVMPELVRPHISAAEWDYWYAGKPAAEALTDTLGQPAIPEGHVREGGSYLERMSRVRVWNAFMDEHSYLVRRWREFLGVLVALAIGALFGLLHAVLTVVLGLSQHVSGIGITLFASASYFTYRTALPDVTSPPRIIPFQPIAIPGLSDLPFIGPALFQQTPMTMLALLLVVVVAFVLYRTPLGLAIRAVGDNPASVEAQGLSVRGLRIGAVVVGSALMALGGAFLTMSAFDAFFFGMVNGRGWICIALVVFASWQPGKALLGALLFGAFDAFQIRLQAEIGQVVPGQVFLMLPYLLSIVALVVVARRADYPRALLQPWFKGQRH